MMTKSGVFISYARKDGETFANEIRERLKNDAPDVRVWLDRQEIEGGVGWWRQIEEALERVEFLVIVMTDAALTSDVTRKEWRTARQKGVCVYPVKGPGFDFSDLRLTRWMKRAHIYDLDIQWKTFVEHIRRGCQATRVPFMAPDLPAGFVQRSSEFKQLRSLLLVPEKRDPVAITTALTGAGGFGKTTLACALCHDDDIALAFDDGILWTTLGQAPHVADALAKLYAGLTGERPQFKDAEDAAATLAEKLEHKNCLIVVDDVWDPAHLTPFLHGGPGCARLITSRQIQVASEANAKRVSVDEMSSDEAVEILAARLIPRPDDLTPFRNLAHRLGEWPLLLTFAAATMARRIARGATVANALAYVNAALERGGVIALDRKSDVDRHAAVASTVAASLDLFEDEEQRRYRDLAVFPEDEPVPLRVIVDLWHWDEFETERLIEKLADASLLDVDLRMGTVRLHDVLRAYLASLLGAAGVLSANANLLDQWNDVHRLPYDYAWRRIGYHLHGAGRHEDLKALLLNVDWLRAKLEATEIDALVREFDYASATPELQLLQDSLRLSSHVLAKSKSKLAEQLLARLPDGELFVRQSILTQALMNRQPWLRPLRPSLMQPGGSLLRTLEGHEHTVAAVAVTLDGKRAVSGSWDLTLKVWDLGSGRELKTLRGHTSLVNAVALMQDGQRAVSGSSDSTLKVWDLESGRELQTFEGHTASVSAVALTSDGKRAVSASWDKTLKVWDLENGDELHTLEGHADRVTAIALMADGEHAVSGSDDKTLKVWDLERGCEVRTLAAHEGTVTVVALTADGTRAVSSSYSLLDEGTLRVWDLETGREVRKLEGHREEVTAVAITPDGKRAISASRDDTLKVWDMESGREVRTLEGHIIGVKSIALTADGKRAVSGSHDKTLRVWDLGLERKVRTLEGHRSEVTAVALTLDGKRAVSASRDNTLKVWDLERGRELRTLQGHTREVTEVALTADGKQAVSGSVDSRLKVWDLESGRELHTLKGHGNHPITALALASDARRAVSGSSETVFLALDPESGRELRTIKEDDDDRQTALAFTKGDLGSGSEHTLKVWDLENGRELRSLAGKGTLTEIALTRDGKRLVCATRDDTKNYYRGVDASVRRDHTLKVWDLESGRELRTLKGHTGAVNVVALTWDGRRAVSGSEDNTLKVWDLESGRELHTLKGHGGTIGAVALTLDGNRAVSGSSDNTLKVWDLESGRELQTLKGHGGTVRAVALTPDGRRAVSASDDCTVAVWNVATGELGSTFGADAAVQACAAAFDGLTFVAGDTQGCVHVLRLENPA